MANWIVLKFGGTSVSSLARWQTIAAAIREKLAGDSRVMVVCSALWKVSDQLEELVVKAPQGKFKKSLELLRSRHLALAAEMDVDPGCIAEELDLLERLATGVSLTGECTARLRAQLLACGELMSTRLGHQYLHKQGLESDWVDARHLLKAREVAGQRSEQAFLSASCDYAPEPGLAAKLGPARVVITQGFIASNHQGKTVLLGRGGSDTSAVALAAALKAQCCEIYSDVDGVFSADPRKVPTAALLDEIDYDEMLELARHGAQVLKSEAVQLARRHNLTLVARSTFKDVPGTVVRRVHRGRDRRVVGIAGRTDIVRLEVCGNETPADMLESLAGCDLLYSNPGSNGLGFVVSAENIGNVDAFVNELGNKYKGHLNVSAGHGAVSAVGGRVGEDPALGLAIYQRLQSARLACAGSYLSPHSVTCLLERDRVEEAVGLLHESLVTA
ncbi:MAG: aspartate kinase [Candidatus Eremiobacteraeota bacterium]|nr:aspartate kinase [Candidatus Eremiobacteraeota bacterium]